MPVRSGAPPRWGVTIEWARAFFTQAPTPDDPMPLLRQVCSVILIIAAFVVASNSVARLREPVATSASLDVVAQDAPAIVPESERSPLPRDLFQTPAPRVAPQATQQRATVLADMSKELQLVGVLEGESPRALIQNMRSASVHTLGVGQTLGEFTVVGIHALRVVLEWKGQNYELAM